MSNHIQHIDDERDMDNGIIVTLAYGYSFEPRYHEGVRGFDTMREMRAATAKKEIYTCGCALCVSKKGQTK
jgi:hypothetical protein